MRDTTFLNKVKAVKGQAVEFLCNLAVDRSISGNPTFDDGFTVPNTTRIVFESRSGHADTGVVGAHMRNDGQNALTLRLSTGGEFQIENSAGIEVLDIDEDTGEMTAQHNINHEAGAVFTNWKYEYNATEDSLDLVYTG